MLSDCSDFIFRYGIISHEVNMKKILSGILSLTMLSGCAVIRQEDKSLQTYETYYHVVEENLNFLERSDNYTVSGNVSQMDDGSYRYYLFVDKPQVAMYDCIVFVVENNVYFTDATTMMPTLGIFDSPATLIPYQVNTEQHYYSGIALGGECDSDSIDIELMVEWKDRSKKDMNREFLSFTLTTDGFSTDDIKSVIPEETEAETDKDKETDDDEEDSEDETSEEDDESEEETEEE